MLVTTVPNWQLLTALILLWLAVLAARFVPGSGLRHHIAAHGRENRFHQDPAMLFIVSHDYSWLSPVA